MVRRRLGFYLLPGNTRKNKLLNWEFFGDDHFSFVVEAHVNYIGVDAVKVKNSDTKSISSDLLLVNFVVIVVLYQNRDFFTH